MNKKELDQLRTAVSDYMQSEGCSCCRDIDAHFEHGKKLAQLLKVLMYSDKSGYDFYRFATKYKGK